MSSSMQPTSTPSARRSIAATTFLPARASARVSSIQGAAPPGGYGWGILEVKRAISQSPASRSMAGPSPGARARNRSRTVSIGSAASAPVVGIDFDIAVGQIAGPDMGPAPADTDIHGDGDLA